MVFGFFVWFLFCLFLFLGWWFALLFTPSRTVWAVYWSRLSFDFPMREHTGHCTIRFMALFFCSNASIALARSLCKCLLAVLITACEAKAVTASRLVVSSRMMSFHIGKRGQHKNQERAPTKQKTAKPTETQTQKETHNQAVE